MPNKIESQRHIRSEALAWLASYIIIPRTRQVPSVRSVDVPKIVYQNDAVVVRMPGIAHLVAVANVIGCVQSDALETDAHRMLVRWRLGRLGVCASREK